MDINFSVCHKGHPMTQTVQNKNTTAAAFRGGSEMWQMKSLIISFSQHSVFLLNDYLIIFNLVKWPHACEVWWLDLVMFYIFFILKKYEPKTKTNEELILLTIIDCVVKAWFICATEVHCVFNSFLTTIELFGREELAISGFGYTDYSC